MLPRGKYMARGRVFWWRLDNKGNPAGRSNPNTILDTHQYKVNITDGEVKYLTANVISEAMYAQRNEDGNAYVLLD